MAYNYQYYDHSLYCQCTQPIYKVVTDNTNIPIALDELKKACHLDHLIGDTSEDAFLTTILNASVACFEKISRRVLMQKTFRTFRDLWWGCYELRRSPLVSITSIKYFDEDGNEQTVDSVNYFIVEDPFYSLVQFINDYDFQDLRPNRPQNITIDFIAGYINDNTEWTTELMDLKTALMQHVCFLYENRGDCSIEGMTPLSSKMVYNKYKIWEM